MNRFFRSSIPEKYPTEAIFRKLIPITQMEKEEFYMELFFLHIRSSVRQNGNSFSKSLSN